jgi:hypothetical protein
MGRPANAVATPTAAISGFPQGHSCHSTMTTKELRKALGP